MSKTKTVCVLGSGLIGGAFIKHLRETEPDILVLTLDDLTWAPRRIEHEPPIYDILKIFDDLIADGRRIDVVVNAIGAVGKPNVDWCDEHKKETKYGNVAIPVELSWLLQRIGVPLIHISTGCIFDGSNGGMGFSVDDDPNFIGSYYSETKALAEHRLRELQNKEGGYTEIHRIRIPFWGEPDPRNLFDKLQAYDPIVDEDNSMTSVPDYLAFLTDRVIEIAGKKPNNTFVIKHAVNKGSIRHSEVLGFMRDTVHLPIAPKTFISGEELNSRTKVPRSNCVLADEELPDIRLSMLESLSIYSKNYGKN